MICELSMLAIEFASLDEIGMRSPSPPRPRSAPVIASSPTPIVEALTVFEVFACLAFLVRGADVVDLGAFHRRLIGFTPKARVVAMPTPEAGIRLDFDAAFLAGELWSFVFRPDGWSFARRMRFCCSVSPEAGAGAECFVDVADSSADFRRA